METRAEITRKHPRGPWVSFEVDDLVVVDGWRVGRIAGAPYNAHGVRVAPVRFGSGKLQSFPVHRLRRTR